MDFYRARSLAVNTGAYLFCASLTVAGAAILPRVLPSPKSLENTVQGGSTQDTSSKATYTGKAVVGGIIGLAVSTVLSCSVIACLEKMEYIGRRR